MGLRIYPDIDDFYDADERRRESTELEFGNRWHDADGHRYSLSWVEDTGELILQRLDPSTESSWATGPVGTVVDGVITGAIESVSRL